MEATREIAYRRPGVNKPLQLDKDDIASMGYDEYKKLGIGINKKILNDMIVKSGFGQDAYTGTLTTASITNPIQFLQTIMPGVVRITTAPRNIDELVGISYVGNFEDEEIVQRILEGTGSPTPYGDYTNIPFASWNMNFARRTVVRFEEGIRVGYLEELRASRMMINSAAEKRVSANTVLETARNSVGFFGFNGGTNRTYGFLNDPNLPAYVTVAAGASTSTLWSTKTYNEIVADILTAIAALRTQSQGVVDPKKVRLILALPTAAVDRLATVPQFGNSVASWIQQNYANITVVSAPELNGANGGANVFYLYAESVDDASSDGGVTFSQMVPSKFQFIGVDKDAKYYIEDYANATAGVMCKRPYAVQRFTGI